MSTDDWQYIELDRRFLDFEDSDDVEDAAYKSYLSGLPYGNRNVSWNQLLESPYVVVLGEPGTGKTVELRERAHTLQHDGKYAFFVRLDRLVGGLLDSALDPPDEARFQQWTRSRDTAIFFLDSVDEAKLLKLEAFSDALSNLARSLSHRGLQRARLVEDRQNRETALLMAIDCWYSLQRPRKKLTLLRKGVRDEPMLSRMLGMRIDSPLVFCLGRWYQRHGLHDLNWRLEQLRRHSNELYWYLRNQWWLQTHSRLLRSGEATRALYQLVLDCRDRHDYGGAEWQDLIPNYGKRVAQAARDGWIASWRKFRPLLLHEKPIPNQTDSRVVLGLVGIRTAIDEGQLDVHQLSLDEAALATRYAVNELNGFPYWLTDITASHADAVLKVLSEHVAAEWNTSGDDEHFHGVLSKLAYGPPEFRRLLEGVILDKLSQTEPPNLQVLRTALMLLVHDGITDLPQLLSLAEARAATAQDTNRRTLWLNLWLQLEWRGALGFLKRYLEQHHAVAKQFMVGLCAGLRGRFHANELAVDAPAYLSSDSLRELIPLVFTYVHSADDIERANTGAYSPTTRDDAQDFRNALMQHLARSKDPGVYETLMRLVDDPSMTHLREWVLHLVDQRAALDAEGSPWEPDDVATFAREYETDPKSVHDLFKIALTRFEEIKARRHYGSSW